MTTRHFAMLALAAGSVWAQRHSPDDVLKTWFPDGTGLEIHTESSGPNTPLSTSGAVAVVSGGIHRVVLDNQARILFAYDIEARKTAQGTVMMRIKPVDEEKMPAYKAAPGTVPTLAAARDFPPLHPGDEVQVDILFHPTTGERIYDILRISTSPPPVSKPRKPTANQFSFQEMRVVLNGRTIREPGNNWIIGSAAMLYVPGKGAYYLSLSPSPDLPFRAAGWVDHAVLRFKIDEDLVEIFSKSNVLQKSDYGTVWVYHDSSQVDRLEQELAELRQRVGPRHPDILLREAALRRPFEIHTADDVESLLPKKKPKEE